MIRVKRGQKENLPTGYPGEPLMCLDNGEFYVGGNHGNVLINGPWVTPEAYGAKGDGVTDDTVAIQATITAGAGSSKPVVLSGGYLISDTLSLPENTIIFGHIPPIDYRTLARFTPKPTITINAANKDIFKLDQTDLYLGYVWSVKIANIKLVGTGAGTGVGINFDNAAFCEVSNVTIDGLYNGIYIDVGMSNTFNNINISRCLNACVYIDSGGVTTTQTFNHVFMRESPYAIINRATISNHTFNTVYNDCLIESTSSGGVLLEKGAAATFNNLYVENVTLAASNVDNCIFECGLTGTGPTSTSVLNINGGQIAGGYGGSTTGSATFRTKDWYIININGGRYENTVYFHEQIAGYTQLCDLNLSGVIVVGTDLYTEFDDATQIHGSFVDGSLPNGERFREKIPTISDLTVSSLVADDVDAKVVSLTNLSVTVPNGGFDSDTSGWTATRSTLASVVGGQAGNCLEITHDGTAPNAATDQRVFGLVPGITYTISGYVKSGTSGDGGYQIVVYPKIVSTPLVTVAGTSSGAWVQDSDNFANPASNSEVVIYLIKNNTDVGTMLFDTITLTAVAPTAPTDGFSLYSDDISAGNAAPHFRTEAGDIVKLYKQVLAADLKEDYTTGDLDTEAEVIAAVNATNAKINALITAIQNTGILAAA